MRDTKLPSLGDAELRRMSRTELTDLLEKILFRLRMLDSEEIQREMVTKSQTLRIESAKTN